MKKLILISFCVLIVACSATDQESSRDKFKAVENSTGKVIGNAGEIVGAGVNALDKSWETPQEQEKKKEESEQVVTPTAIE